jgi:hypothetical protein
MKKLLCQFHWDCGRQGNVDGLFITTEQEIESIIGKSVHFGEILGKHSEIYGTIEDGEITVVSDEQDKIEWLQGIMGETISGYNPFYYLQEDQ